MGRGGGGQVAWPYGGALGWAWLGVTVLACGLSMLGVLSAWQTFGIALHTSKRGLHAPVEAGYDMILAICLVVHVVQVLFDATMEFVSCMHAACIVAWVLFDITVQHFCPEVWCVYCHDLYATTQLHDVRCLHGVCVLYACSLYSRMGVVQHHCAASLPQGVVCLCHMSGSSALACE